jgi:hypothetical protein
LIPKRRSSSIRPTTVVTHTISTTAAKPSASIKPLERAVVANTKPGSPRGIKP